MKIADFLTINAFPPNALGCSHLEIKNQPKRTNQRITGLLNPLYFKATTTSSRFIP